MYAIIEEFGGQRRVTQGEEFLIDLQNGGEAKVGSSIAFDKVLVIGKEGGDAKVGQPYVQGASVKVEVLESLVKGEKLDIHHFREKKTWRKKTGHRQKYTKVKVTAING
jgi:large subunit ribosomal protein L21